MVSPIVSIDAMGGDFGPRCIVPACISCLQSHSSLELILVGSADDIVRHIDPSQAYAKRLHIHHASEVVAMDERPSRALRGKPDASMRIALERLAAGDAQACVSAGNTGALMALSRQLLPRMPGIDRPALMATLPTRSGESLILDLGANLDCTARQLLQFACLGVSAAQARGVASPRVALLNVGVEATKGNQVVQQAADLLSRAGLNYSGFIEADTLFEGIADVVVCDGFAGNVLLKSSEGAARLLFERLSGSMQAIPGHALVALRQLMQRELDPGRRNGASLLGLQGVVVKSHGGARADAFAFAIQRAIADVESDLPGRIQVNLASSLST